ncbi:hypothetical protein ES703_71282 [subsurface metagenome]
MAADIDRPAVHVHRALTVARAKVLRRPSNGSNPKARIATPHTIKVTRAHRIVIRGGIILIIVAFPRLRSPYVKRGAFVDCQFVVHAGVPVGRVINIIGAISKKVRPAVFVRVLTVAPANINIVGLRRRANIGLKGWGVGIQIFRIFYTGSSLSNKDNCVRIRHLIRFFHIKFSFQEVNDIIVVIIVPEPIHCPPVVRFVPVVAGAKVAPPARSIIKLSRC